MIKFIFIGLLSLLFAHEPEDPAFQSDPKAKAILDKTSETFKQLASLKANLLITIQFPEQDAYDQKSEVYLKGQNYKLVMEDEEILCDNKSVWRYLKDMNEVQINDYEPASDEITPTNIFNIYENDFYSLYVGPVSENGQSYEEIELSPMDKSKSYFKVKVWISTSDNLIHKMKVFDKNGSRYTYAITNLDTNIGLEDSFFQFRKADYPGVRIEDLRF
jgi:outer membrane lipoprotein-sorting protein